MMDSETAVISHVVTCHHTVRSYGLVMEFMVLIITVNQGLSVSSVIVASQYRLQVGKV